MYGINLTQARVEHVCELCDTILYSITTRRVGNTDLCDKCFDLHGQFLLNLISERVKLLKWERERDAALQSGGGNKDNASIRISN
jgi:hypothetical protein